MMKKLSLLVVGAAGYVLGSRAGRERYEQIKSQTTKAWNNPKVQETVSDVQAKAKETGADVGSKVAETASSVKDTVTDKVSGSGDEGTRADVPPVASDPSTDDLGAPATPGRTAL